jgi:hypothetical protein
MPTQISDPTILVNNDAVAIVPNSAEIDEGLGEQKARAASLGGGSSQIVYSRDVSTNMGVLKFKMPGTLENIEKAREWKLNTNQNVVQVLGSTAEGFLTRTMVEAGLLPKVVIPLAADGDIAIEFTGQAMA